MSETFSMTFQIIEGIKIKTVEMQANLWQDAAIRPFNLLFYAATDGKKHYIIHESGYVLSSGSNAPSAKESAKRAISELQFKTDLGCRIQGHKNLIAQCLNLQRRLHQHSWQ